MQEVVKAFDAISVSSDISIVTSVPYHRENAYTASSDLVLLNLDQQMFGFEEAFLK